MKLFIFLIYITTLTISGSAFATDIDINSMFGTRKACFIISDLSTGKIIKEYNPKMCAERLPPCSTFKVAAALMAFENGILKDENQIIKWDGTHHSRGELNKDQTPYTWMSNSVMWVTQWITPQLKQPAIDKFIKKFKYGNHDFSGGLTKAWQDSSLKISTIEELNFISNLWMEKLPVSKRTVELTKKIIFIKKLKTGSEFYGKTGTGCIDKGCDVRSGRMLGRFHGVIVSGKNTYGIAGTTIDTKPESAPAGPRLRSTLEEIILKLGL